MSIIRDAATGRFLSGTSYEHWKGKKRPLELVEQHRLFMLYNNPFKGRKHTEETKHKMRLAKLNKRGKLANNWQGGKTQGQHIRMTADFMDWRDSVFRRDDYTCKTCGQYGGILNAHHIKSFSKFPESRLNIDNGITLCKNCHNKIHWRT